MIIARCIPDGQDRCRTRRLEGGIPTVATALPQPSTEPEIRVRVELGPRAYEVRVVSGRGAGFGAFARSALDATWSGRNCRRALLVTDANLAARGPGYIEALTGVGIVATMAVLPPG